MGMFVNLHNHTEYSLLDGMCATYSIAKRAAEMDQPAVAMTDHGNLHGLVKFYKACKASDVKPIIGCEIYVSQNRLERTDNGAFHLVLLARDKIGLSNLMKIVSDASINGFYRRPRTDLTALREYSKGLICLSACRKGMIPHAIVNNDLEEAERLARTYMDIFEDFYIEIQASDAAEQIGVNQQLVALAEKIGVKYVVTNDSHYIAPEDAKVHDVELAMQTGTLVRNPDRLRLDSDCYWLKSEDETREYLRKSISDETVIDKAIVTSLEIANMCRAELELGRVLFPKVDVPEGYTADDIFRIEAHKGLADMFAEEKLDEQKYSERLEYELSVLSEAGFAPYFLIVQDIVRTAKSRGIRVGPGRGSAGGPLTTRTLGITTIDPIKHNLPFERFWYRGRSGFPDIDLDFPKNRRKEVFQHIIDKYGIDHCAHIVTFSTLKTKMLLRDICRAIDIPLEEADLIAGAVPDTITDESTGDRVDITIEVALEESEDLQAWRDKYPWLFEVAAKLQGLPRHTSVHAGGIVIAPMPMFGEIPLMRNKNEDDQLPITQLDMDDVEALGFIKMDLLVVDELEVIDNTAKAIKERYGEDIVFEKIPLDDEKVYDNICSLYNVGAFQIDTPIGAQMCGQIQPRNFNELVDILALARPGPMKTGQDKEYALVKTGQKTPEYLHPLLEPILGSSYGVMLYQEQLMKMAKVLANFSDEDTDALRKGVAKKKKDVLDKLSAAFIEGCKNAQTLDEETALELWEQIKLFGGYLFNLSHSVAYAYITYWTVWLKLYYPVEFMAALLTNEYAGSGDTKDTKINQAIGECRRLNITCLGPNINESTDKFEVVDSNTIRYSFYGIKGVGEAAVRAIMEHRPYASLQDFIERVPKKQCNARVVRILILAGAFDFYNPNRLELLAEFEATRKEEAPKEIYINKNQNIKLPKEYDDLARLRFEKELTGVYISGHPLENLSVDDWRIARPKSQVTIAGMIVAHRKTVVKKGKAAGRKMGVMKIDTPYGTIGVVLFPNEFDAYGHLMGKNKLVQVKGIMDHRNNERQLVANEIVELDINNEVQEMIISV